ncbi:sigma-70 family RNA polymerase sigma factor [Actinomadura sp. DC4]|uniref:sigma-70 family RNA polymerase sigma factor n=1 Tax=Actinomadura sp. DC4 TaxID=3055069 RepID=UPI0025B04888|nr:sigma-70 family RNA polymerase sigma factor [Actinomadura sp. DC4]MDN3351326.1 sigma-70 family RNA polymerase sigma factor [Actinomadura sp. DC4]
MPGVGTVRAAQRGDRQALADLASGCLPLLYNIVGRALNGHPDVDDVVQETVLRTLRGVSGLRQASSFRSWLVAVAIRQIRDYHRSRPRSTPLEDVPDVADPGADFAEVTILRLRLSGQRKEIAEATRWLDEDDRELLALWWLEEGGELERADLVAALDLPGPHVAVRVQRMKRQLDVGRAVVRVLADPGECAGLAALLADWDGRPAPLWRKRFARHIRDCAACSARSSDLIPAERLLASLPLVPVPLALAHGAAVPGAAAHARHAGKLLHLPAKALVAVPLAGAAVAGLVGYATLGRGGAERPAAATERGVPATSPAVRDPSRSPVPTPPAPTLMAKGHPPVVSAAASSCLKGVATWKFGAASTALKSSGACWYYDWAAETSGITKPSGVEFVPMIWGSKSVTAATLAQAKARGRTLLGFNEPDMAAQANMSPAQALALWPKLTATGMRIGSPAVAANGATAGGWLDRFMRGAAARHYRVDFITLHWYGSDFDSSRAVAQLRQYVQAVYARYHKPIWLTEYALIRFGATSTYPSQSRQAAFLKASTTMLAGLKGVERYAWFGLPATKGSGTGLFTEAGTPNTVGRAFQGLPRTKR